ncbi:MAG: 16S rRNA (uracil(1498)-N(3))-methyltransferase [Bacteroidales bacterium]|nr:16S rRNA (uracil(1498)-N(3))-methyltransferase [Bacteroidales bacterium]
MEIFFAREIDGTFCHLTEEESAHCVKVLRHREGDEIHVIDGEGTFYTCRLCDASPKGATAQILEVEKDWGAHPYHLSMAVCPTKNNDRYEWFAEKATEMGLDRIAPVIGEHSERRVFKTERLAKILLSASKQSLKGAIPQISEPLSVKEFIKECDAELKLICYCFEEETLRRSIKEVLAEKAAENCTIAILIGPEGDFSRDEAKLAMENGFIPVHLGDSRLRTETAALTATAAVYFNYMK